MKRLKTFKGGTALTTRRALVSLKQSRLTGGGATLADVIEKSPVAFKCKRTTGHVHNWIPGADIEVCTKCGLTVPKGSPK